MISGFFTPGEPLFIDLDIPKIFQKYKKSMGIFFKTAIFINLTISKIEFFANLYQTCNRRGPGNDEDPFQTSRKSWIWDHYLSKTWNGHLVRRTKYFQKHWREFWKIKICLETLHVFVFLIFWEYWKSNTIFGENSWNLWDFKILKLSHIAT